MTSEHEAPNPPPTEAERLDAMEFLLGQMALQIEADNAAMRAQMHRLLTAVERIAPAALAPPTEDEDAEPFTVDALCSWAQACVERMRAHQAATARQMVAIGEVTMRVAALGAELRETPQPEIGPDVHAALEKARRRRPQG